GTWGGRQGAGRGRRGGLGRTGLVARPGATRIAVSRAAHSPYVELLLRHGAFMGRIVHAGASCGGELVRPGVRRPSEPEGERRDRTEVLRLRLLSGRFTGSGAGHHSDSGVAVPSKIRGLCLCL